MESIKMVFVSNYINHHQIPLCRALYRCMNGSFAFLQTEPMEEERVQMGWNGQVEETYLKRYYEEPEECARLVLEAEVVLFGGTDDESYIQERLKSGKMVFRYAERLYRTGQWRAISPRGLRKKYLDHVRYRRAPVYLLCAGAYVPSDFHIVRAYPQKMFCWGYFPEAKHYDVEELMSGKGYPVQNGAEKIPYLLWSGRMIECKHPELVVETAKYLRDKEIAFHLDVIGGGVLEQKVRDMVREYGLEEQVSLKGFLSPAEVRAYMERADVYLVTSDRYEGWGAVTNESMNSGCAVVADHMIGSAPYLIRHGENGYLYRDGDARMLFETVEELIKNPEKREAAGRRAYETIRDVWNAEKAAAGLCRLISELTGQCPDGGMASESAKAHRSAEGFQPCQPAPVISERRMFRYLTGK